MNKIASPRVLFLTSLVLLAAFSRLLPHPPNFTAVGAIALFSGSLIASRFGRFLVPLVAMYLSDLVLNNVVYPGEGFVWFTSGAIFIYGAIALIAVLGSTVIRKVVPGRILGGSVLASALFFVVTNFGVWLTAGLYPATWQGLMLSYEMAIPFFWNTLAADLFFSTLLFGSYMLVTVRFPKLARA